MLASNDIRLSLFLTSLEPLTKLTAGKDKRQPKETTR
jgi:hypothetical protein